MTNDELRALWRKAGGEFHGPSVETATMPEAQLLAFLRAPIDMVLHCPNCGLQHIDAPEEDSHAASDGTETRWMNPPHRSHLCHACDYVWRPADVPTNGVRAVKTAGKADSPIRAVPDDRVLK